MLDRPPVSDERLAGALNEAYGMGIRNLTFLALGHDSNAWAFRATADAGTLFVKVRRHVDPARLRLVRYLAEHAVPEVVAPLWTLNADLSMAIDGFHVIVYPFLDGDLAADVGLSDRQWVDYGRIVRAIHRSRLDMDLAAALPQETFWPVWGATIDDVARAAGTADGDETRGAFRLLWSECGTEIEALRQRVDQLGERLRRRLDASARAAFVPCHADIHTHNVLVAPDGSLRVFDWDEALLAPRERDLMFMMGSPIGLAPGKRELGLFESGYGELAIDLETLAYYHVDWAVQDIAGYGRQVMLDPMSAESRAYAFRVLMGCFDPGGEFEVAQRYSAMLDL